MRIIDLKHYILETLKKTESEREAESFTSYLMEEIVGKDSLFVQLEPSFEVTNDILLKINEIISELRTGKPLQYILGNACFYGMTFCVNPDVLIPRPETEELVNWILNDFGESFSGKGLDVCTGSGCIVSVLAKERPKAEWQAIDLFENVIATAEKNIDLQKVKAKCFKMDVLSDDFLNFGNFDYDILVSNPPYITEKEKKEMSKRVRDFEPHTSLFVTDEHPLIFYEALLKWGNIHLRKSAGIYVEINEKLSRECVELFKKNNYTSIELRKDMQKKDRMIKGIKA